MKQFLPSLALILVSGMLACCEKIEDQFASGRICVKVVSSEMGLPKGASATRSVMTKAIPVVPPEVPSVSTLKIDFPSLSTMGTKGVAEDTFRHLYENMLNVPMGALEIVASAEPTNDGGVWTWNVSDYNCIGQKYAVALTGTEAGEKVNWALSVTRDGTGGFKNYTWLEGWSAKDGSEGQWFVRVSPYDTDVLVTSDWTAENGRLLACRNTYSLEHAMGGIGAFFNGSYVEYSASATDERFNNSLKICYFQIGNHEVGLNLEWNPETNAFRSSMNGGNWVE